MEFDDFWGVNNKKKPKLEKNIIDREVPYEEFEDMNFKEKMGYFESLENTLIDEKDYKNYRIEFRKYPKGYKCDKDIYLPNIVYAHGFEYDPSTEFGKKRGKMIGTGKTLKEAFGNAKKYIDNQDKNISKTEKREIERQLKKQKELDKIIIRLRELIVIGARRKLRKEEEEEIMDLRNKLYNLKN